MSDEPLQTDEVEQALTRCRTCSLVYLSPNGAEVSLDINFDENSERAPWRIVYLCGDVPDKPLLKQLLALGFELREWSVVSSSPIYELSRSCFGIRAAAIKALLAARMLPGVPEHAWLWITIPEYEQREYPPPKPPSPWPPTDA